MLANYLSGISNLKIIINILDILLVWFLVYKLLIILKGTRGMQLVKGIFIVIAFRIFFNIIGFDIMTYIFDQLVTWGVLGIIIIFQPEIRRALEHLGRANLQSFFKFNYKEVNKNEKNNIIKIISSATRHMGRRRIGALIVLENYNTLDEYVERGIEINADISNELLINIFIPNTPLHDGAMILSKDKIRAASCVLPLTDNRNIASNYGTRHRAAIGLSEIVDAIIVVVSEETGKISVCKEGKLISDFSEEELSLYLSKNWLPENETSTKEINTHEGK